MSDIPLIDLQSQLDCPEVEAAIAEQIGQACTNTGFFAISGHGIPETTIEHCWQASLKFFALSESEKLKLRMPYAGYPYGFAPMEAETLSHSRGQQAPPDLKETFSVGPNTPPPPGISAKETVFVFSENQWPHRPPDFQEAWQVCHKAMAQLAERLMMLFALALKLPRNHFDDFLRQPISAQLTYWSGSGLSRLYCARRFWTCSAETSIPCACILSRVDVTMSPGGNWMTTKTITEMSASVGNMPPMRRAMYHFMYSLDLDIP